ncbi:Crp/Fnr family transcriptional regulator [Salinisphaera sp. SPP-AMP-43]|uniref:Crp/Fnr family transcriptional regulator n=1 Tax=Salinisphaera sp. SPP-AMP-43 TaxID=3121288 RepID=UPI003C6DBC41
MLNLAFEPVVARGWLSRQPDGFINDVIGIARLRRYGAGRTIAEAHVPGGGLYGILEGCVEMRIGRASGESSLVNLFWPGDWFGEATVIAGAACVGSLHARSDVILTEIPLPRLRVICNQTPERWRCIAQLAIENHADTTATTASLMMRDGRARCIAALLRLGGCSKNASSHTCGPRVPISQEEIAAAANLCRNSAGAVLRELEAQGVIAVGYRNITILSIDRLHDRLAELTA